MFKLRSRKSIAVRTVEPTLRAAFTDGEIASMAHLGTLTSFAPGATLMAEATNGTHAFFITSGTAAVSRAKTVIAMVSPGDLVGEQALVTGNERNATVTALEPVTALQFDQTQFAWLRLESAKVRTLSDELITARG